MNIDTYIEKSYIQEIGNFRYKNEKVQNSNANK